jgi:putative DNA primase/helicase
MSTPIRDAAFQYIHDGFSVVPITQGEKRPALESLKEYQTKIPTEAELNEWFSDDNQVAIMCGCVSGNLVVFDFDGEKWDELLTEFITLFPELQNTRIVRTGSFKAHIYVRCTELPEDVTRIVRSFPDRGEIELRANKHYVLAPPSIHPSGNQYQFCNPETPILVIPHERLTEVINWLNESRRVAPAPQVNEERQTINLTSNQKEVLARFYTRRLIGQCRRGKHRNAKGFELAMRLLNLGFTQEGALPYMEEFQRDVPSKDHPYTLEEALASLGSAASQKREAPWIPEGFFRVDPRTGELTDRELLTEQISQKLLEYHLSDAGNAESFVELSGGDFCFVKELGKWLRWDGVRWVEEDEEVYLKMQETARIRNRLALSIEDMDRRRKFQNWANTSESNFRVKAALEVAEKYLRRKFIDFDNVPYILCCENGIVNLRTGEFRQATHSDWIYKSTGVAYDRDARYPRWNRFLNEIFQGNIPLIEFLKRAIGYTLTGDVTEQCLFLCHGSGANGKSVLFDTLGNLLGDYGQSTPSSTFKEMKYEGGNASPEVARMAGARLVKSVEVKEKVTLNTERVKALTGGDKIVARFLFQEMFEFSPQFKIWIAVNHLPKVNDTSVAIWRRIHKIPFNAYFPPGENDPNLTSTLKAELSGILNWAIEGCLEWQRDRLNPPQVVLNATNEYRQESDVVGRFLREETGTKPDTQVRSGLLYERFRVWCEKQGENPLTQKEFNQEMGTKGHRIEKRKDANYWVGITLWT